MNQHIHKFENVASPQIIELSNLNVSEMEENGEAIIVENALAGISGHQQSQINLINDNSIQVGFNLSKSKKLHLIFNF